MTGVVGISLENAVGRRVVSSGIHGIRASLVQGRRESDIASHEASDGDLRHDDDGFLSATLLIVLAFPPQFQFPRLIRRVKERE